MSSTRGAVLILGSCALALWFALPKRPDALPRLMVVSFVAFTFGSLFSGNVGLLLQGVALVGGFGLWLLAPRDDRRGTAVVIACGLIIGYWAILMFHGNVPDLNTGLLGFRKTVLAIGGIVLGCAVARKAIPRVELLIVRLISLAVAVSLLGYFFFPQIAELVPRAADKYTALYRGQERLQGVFSGPFHVAGAAVLLIGWALVRRKTYPRLSAIAFAIGAVATYFTFVRSAYIAVVLIVLAAALAATSVTARVRRLYILAIAGVVAYLILARGGPLTDTAESISSFSSDGRFQNRIPEWQTGLRMFLDSPIYGWGSGSAGDTLGPAFAGGEHVTPHNILLKFAVEGGLIGLVLLIAVVSTVASGISWRDQQGQLATVSAVGLLAMGITGSSIDTLPVSYLALVLVGLGVGLTTPDGKSNVTDHVVQDAVDRREATPRPVPGLRRDPAR
ncbi:O-antigen ligase family protein [Rhodococcoides fascians]|uniref:O-antigen ligase family protein n=1 Tax=Rhodococcoides fascians TaxID=1828 RepID=UPI0012D2ED5F|nr:O-antigen ligase family protein [Rhodococcus fascians]